jgi:hypothetical protein
MAIGALALENSTGSRHSASGAFALNNNTTAYNNTANGYSALLSNTTGISNTATGAFALQNNTTGSSNIAIGTAAGSKLTTGDNNIDISSLGAAGESSTIRIDRPGIQTATYIAGIRGTTTLNANAVPVVIDSAGQLGTVSSSRRFKDDIKADGQEQRSHPWT